MRTALLGGGIYTSGQATFTNVIISGNQAGSKGGGAYVYGSSASLTLDNCSGNGNYLNLGIFGPGVCYTSDATFSMTGDTAISDNIAVNPNP